MASNHGQLNSKTPCLSNFWDAMNRLATNFISKCFGIQDHVSPNYSYEKKKTLGKTLSLEEKRMSDEIKFYNTSDDQCSCSGIKLLSEIYGNDFTCVHLLYLGTDFTDCPKFNIMVTPQWDILVVEISPLEDDKASTVFAV